MSNAELQNELERLRAENEALRQAKLFSGKLSIKVSDKGAVSVYGMGRFPVTLYKEQWEKLFAHKAEIETFIQANAKSLATKDTKPTAETKSIEPESKVVNTPNGQITTTGGGQSPSALADIAGDEPF